MLFIKIVHHFKLFMEELWLDLCFRRGISKDKEAQRFRENLSPEMKRFIETNKKYWAGRKGIAANGFVLVEGYLSKAGHNYLLRTGLVAKAIEEKTGCLPAAIFDISAYQATIQTELYKSFNITKFFYPVKNFSYLIF